MSEASWGILGTGNIARASFLPGLREAGRGRALAVASREGAKAEQWAHEHGVERGIEGYQALLDDDAIDAVYIPLPNTLHAEWTAKALEAGKAVLCEKPLTADPTATRTLLDQASSLSAPLWEAFVFPFQDQHQRLLELIADGAIGEVREVYAAFHFGLGDRQGNIRLSAELGGGALLDVGCYPVRLANALFDGELPRAAVALGATKYGVDVDVSGVVAFDSGRRLTLTCGFNRGYDTGASILGTEGQIALTNPYHPKVDDSLTIIRPGHPPVVENPPTDARSFAAAIRHIHDVVLDGAEPEHLAIHDSMATAETLAALAAALGD